MNKQFKLLAKAALVRAGYTAAETAVALIPVGVMIQEVSWTMVLSTALLAGVLSWIKSLVTNLPEVEKQLLEEAEHAKE